MKDKNKGFTLIEILVSLAILGIVLAGIYSVYTMQHKSYIVQEQVANMQQNERIALQMITRDIRMAGLGLPAPELGINDFGDGVGFDNSDTIAVAYYIFNPDNSSGGRTQIDEGGTGTITTSAVLPVENTTGFAAGDWVLVYPTPLSSSGDISHYALICITRIITGPTGGNLVHAPGGGGSCAGAQIFEYLPSGTVSGFSAGDRVRKINPSEAGSESGIIAYAITNGYVLTRSVNGGAAQPLAENIEDMQIAYGFDSDNNGTVDTWVNNLAALPAGTTMDELREVRVTLVARTTREDPAYNVGARPEVENHDQAQLSGSIITTPAQAAKYRRRVLQSTIRLRNNDGTGAIL